MLTKDKDHAQVSLCCANTRDLAPGSGKVDELPRHCASIPSNCQMKCSCNVSCEEDNMTKNQVETNASNDALRYWWSTPRADLMAQSAAFVTWLLGHIMLALNLKQEKLPLLKQGLFSNRFGILWLAGMVVLSLVITTVPFIRPYLHTSPLSSKVWLVILAVVFSSTWWIEASKTLGRKAQPPR